MHARIAAHRILLLGLVAVVALTAQACGGSAATVAPSVSVAAPVGSESPSAQVASAEPSSLAPTESATASLTAAPSEAPSAAAITPTAAATPPPTPSFVIPSFTSDKELEALLPNSYQGAALKKFSFTGTTLSGSTAQSSKDVLALLSSYGKSPADLSFAVASDPTRKLEVSFAAYRIKGVEASTWAPQLYQLVAKEAPGTTETQANLGGKAVERVVNPKTDDITYAWPRADVLLIVEAKTDALAGPAIAVMP